MRVSLPSVGEDNADDSDSDYGESTSLLTRRLRPAAFKDSIEKSHPPLPTSETYLADLLKFEFSRAKRNHFGYIRCLDPADRETFQAKMVEQIHENCHDPAKQEMIITQGCMKIQTWRRIMKQICTVTTYKLWRSDWWGHVLMESFDGHCKSKEVNLLHSNGHIGRFSFARLYPSSWSNEKASQSFWDEVSD